MVMTESFSACDLPGLRMFMMMLMVVFAMMFMMILIKNIYDDIHDNALLVMKIFFRQSLFITCSGLYAFLLIVLCLAFLTSEVVTDNR